MEKCKHSYTGHLQRRGGRQFELMKVGGRRNRESPRMNLEVSIKQPLRTRGVERIEEDLASNRSQ